jgi:hypothetical protein
MKDWIPGTWRKWLFGPTNAVGSVVICPSCTKGMSVGGNQPFGSCHTIDGDGTIHPSVVCPHCAWHVMARLIGWSSSVNGQVAY